MTFGPPKNPRGETLIALNGYLPLKLIKQFSFAQLPVNRLIKKSHDMIIMGFNNPDPLFINNYSDLLKE